VIKQVLVEPFELAEIGADSAEIIVIHEAIEIVEVGIIGPPGRPGESADGSWVTQTFALGATQQEFTLDFTPRAGSVFVYLNGLLERFWTLDGVTLTLDEPALANDTVTVSYQKET
jgi:hypothetical protein